jgi:hypothetical protein
MHPALTQALAEAHIADRHREAARHRLVRMAAADRPGIRPVMARRLAAVRLVVAGRVSDRTQPISAPSACCPICCLG